MVHIDITVKKVDENQQASGNVHKKITKLLLEHGYDIVGYDVIDEAADDEID